MSVSPRKRSSEVPEVVIYVQSKSPSKKAAAREKAAREESEEFNGLTRIEQIRLRARRKAEKEDRDRQEAESSKRSRSRQRTVESVEINGGNDDDDDEEDLPDLNFGRMATRKSASLSDQPHIKTYGSEFEGSLSSLTTSIDEFSSSLSISGSPIGSAMTQRSRRTIARIEPYVFRPSLDPVSERRQKLKDAKQSAAVQAKIIKTEDFEKSAYAGKSDTIEKVLRDHRREQRKGLDVEGLYTTIRLAEGINGMLQRQEQEQEERDISEEERSQYNSDDDDDTSVASSSRQESPNQSSTRSHLILPEQSLHMEEELERHKRLYLKLTGDDEESQEGKGMYEILQKDKEFANRNRQVGQGEDIGLKEREFWKQDRVQLAKVILPSLDCDSRLYAMLLDYSGNSSHLTSLLSNTLFSIELEDEEDSGVVCEVLSWLVEVAILTLTSKLAFTALQALQGFFSSDSAHKLEAAMTILQRLASILSKLGAKNEILLHCYGTADLSNSTVDIKSSGHVRSGERFRAVERLLQVIESIARTIRQEGSKDDVEEQLQLLVVLLRLGIDPQHSELRIRIEHLLEAILNDIVTKDADSYNLLLSKLMTLLEQCYAPTTRLAILSIMPSTNLYSRSLRRRLAYQILTKATLGKNSKPCCNDFTVLADIVSRKRAAVNPLLATKERDYKQVDANIQLLCFTFSDIALQILDTHSGESEAVVEDKKPAKKGLIKVIQNYHDHDDESATFLQYFLRLPSMVDSNIKIDTHNCKVNLNQVKSIHRIMEALQSQGNQIHEGKGSFLDRSMVKDQLQRLRLMLLYMLTDFGLHPGSESSVTLQQGKLSKWFK